MILTIHLLRSLVVYAIPTQPPPALTNYLHDLLPVFSLVIRRITVAIAAMTSPRERLSLCGTSTSTKRSSPSAPGPRYPRQRPVVTIRGVLISGLTTRSLRTRLCPRSTTHPDPQKDEALPRLTDHHHVPRRVRVRPRRPRRPLRPSLRRLVPRRHRRLVPPCSCRLLCPHCTVVVMLRHIQ